MSIRRRHQLENVADSLKWAKILEMGTKGLESCIYGSVCMCGVQLSSLSNKKKKHNRKKIQQ